MAKSSLVIATRASQLALKQTERVQHALLALYPHLSIEILSLTTEGDVIQDRSLAKVGGKGLFIKTLEEALLSGKADIAVHSMKDVPTEYPEGLHVPVVLARDAVEDVLISRTGETLESLRIGAIVGTASFRRQAQILRARPDLQIRLLRGNVITRLEKLDKGEFDAIILAKAGLDRLAMSDRITQVLSTHVSLPSVGQGVIGIECREADDDTFSLIKHLHDPETMQCVIAERAMVHHLNGTCHTPIGALALVDDVHCSLEGLVASTDGKTICRAKAVGPYDDPEELGIAVAEDLLSQGAKRLLDQFHEGLH